MRRLGLVLAVLAVLPGCTSPNKPPCEGEGCVTAPTTPVITREPGIDFPPLPVNESLRSLRLENCTGYSGYIELPDDWVTQAIPEDFETRGTDTPLVAHVAFFADACERTVIPDAVIPNVFELWFMPAVRTRNSSWEPEDRASFFILEHYVSNETVARQYESWGVPSRTASFTLGQLPVVGGQSTTWDVEAGDVRFSFEYVRGNDLNEVRNTTNYFWTGSDPYLRLTVRVDLQTYFLITPEDGGLMRFEGESPTAALVKAPVARFEGVVHASKSYGMLVDPELFMGGD